jgi:hypothetical protein
MRPTLDSQTKMVILFCCAMLLILQSQEVPGAVVTRVE